MDFESATVSASPDTRAPPDLGQVPQAIHWGWLYSVWSHSTMGLGTGDWVYYAWIIDEGRRHPCANLHAPTRIIRQAVCKVAHGLVHGYVIMHLSL